MNRDDLLKEIQKLGYPLMALGQQIPSNQVLAEVIKSHDLRLWEGFPLMVSYCLSDGTLCYNDLIKYLEKKADIAIFKQLINMSYSLFKYLKLGIASKIRITDLEGYNKELFTLYLGCFQKKNDIAIGDTKLSSDRIITVFKNYYSNIASYSPDLINLRKDFELEFALSQIFSSRQRELFFKRLKGEKMSKTEREYFSRVVKKKIVALANDELHQIAKRLL